MNAGEFNAPTNPTAVYGSDATSTYASNELRNHEVAYITTIGLYDQHNRLLAVGRMAKPL